MINYILSIKVVKITRASKQAGTDARVRPGDFMGELSLFVNGLLMDNTKPEDTEVCIVDGERLKTLMMKYPPTGRAARWEPAGQG